MNSGKQYEQNKFNKRNFKKQTQQNTGAENNEFNKKCNREHQCQNGSSKERICELEGRNFTIIQERTQQKNEKE